MARSVGGSPSDPDSRGIGHFLRMTYCSREFSLGLASFPLLDYNANTLAPFPRISVEHIAHNPNIINCGFVQLHLKISENCGDCQKYFSLRESNVPMLMHCYIETSQRRNTYGMPMHCLESLLNATRYFSRCSRCVGSIHRSGTKLCELGKMSSLWCMNKLVIPTGT